MSTTSRILVAFLAFLAVGWLLVEHQLSRRMQRQYLEAVEEPMVDMAQLFAALLEQQLSDDGKLDVRLIRSAWKVAGERQFTAQIYNVTKSKVDAHLYVADRDGMIVFDSDGGRIEGQNYRDVRDVALTFSGVYGARSTRVDPANADTAIMYVAAPIRHLGAIVGVATISKPASSVLPFRDETRRWLLNLGWVFLAVITAGAYFIVTHFSRPIRRLTAYAQAVARGERVAPPVGGTPEVATLSRAFDEMRRALDGRGYVENYVQTLTHEMKSPVAAIRGAAELLREESMPPDRRARFLSNIEAEADRLQASIDRLLALSALESRQSLDEPQPVSLAALASVVCAQFQPTAEARGVKIELICAAEPTVSGESFLLEIALNNLLQNAIEFSPNESGVTVKVACTRDSASAEWIVEDEGAGIPDYALARIFDRFYSLQHPATGRKSSGLGLCFVREAVELHGGRVVVENRVDRVGVRAVITLPMVERAG